MLQRYCFNGRLARISYVVMSVFVLFCVGLDFGWVDKGVKERLSDLCGVRAVYAYSLILDVFYDSYKSSPWEAFLSFS